ncbi:MAG: hypothetical protein A2270_03715 [Elusimicrobia bacterium RIFOXYA12_FULL_51_18]|nr:MAG: hypothetical protein A2270_03715 [Elusimicrobia bacterium RIFOXYA12_FULL_51_18]OGS31950.1 MAG: hypothetical protein A2218_06680 [Elusimicrobia bacterium RIFOXYA2_FULL_53_38]
MSGWGAAGFPARSRSGFYGEEDRGFRRLWNATARIAARFERTILRIRGRKGRNCYNIFRQYLRNMEILKLYRKGNRNFLALYLRIPWLTG